MRQKPQIKMKKQNLELKLRCPPKGLYLLVLERLADCQKPGKDIVYFPDLFSKIGPSLQVKKDYVWNLLFFFCDLGFITFIKGHGIKLNFEVLKNVK